MQSNAKVVPVLLLTTAGFLGASSHAHAQGAPYHYRGIEHEDIGVTSHLLVGDELHLFDSAGSPAVSIDVRDAESLRTTAPLMPDTWPTGASMHSAAYGVVSGVPGSFAGSCDIGRSSAGYMLGVDYTPLGAATYTVEIFDDGQLVSSSSGHVGAAVEMLVPPSYFLSSQSCVYDWELGLWTWSTNWDSGVEGENGDFDVTGVGLVSGDAIRFKPDSPVPPGVAVERVEIGASGLPQMILMDEALGKFDHLHRGLGADAQMHACSDCLVISNIGSSGDDGVEMDFDKILVGEIGEVRSFHVRWDPLVPVGGGLPAGAFLELSAEGASGPLGELLLLQTTTAVEVVPNYGGVGSGTSTVEVRRDGLPVASFGGIVGLAARAPGFPDGCGKRDQWYPAPFPCFFLEWEQDLMIEVPGHGSFLGDELRVLAEGAGAASALMSFALRARDIPTLRLTEEESTYLSATSYCTSTPNSTGAAAAISASGSSSVAANDLLLRAEPVPDQFGVFFYGPQQASLPFGNGTLCIAGEIGRLAVVAATGNVMTHLVDNTSPPSTTTQITPGSTWNFSAWFRDPAAGGAFFDLSDGLTVVFDL